MCSPIDTVSVKFAASGPAAPELDYETRMRKLDENGVGLFSVPRFTADKCIKDSITVRVRASPRG